MREIINEKTMQEAIDSFLNWKAGYTMHASGTYRLHLERFAEYVHKGLRKVTLDDVVKWQYLLKTKYSMANVAYASMILKNFFKFWAAKGTPIIDPYLIRIPKFVPKSHSPVSVEDFNTLCETATEDSFWDLQKKVVLHMLWDTGMRVGELCSMDISMIDSRKPMAMIVTKKNNKERWIKWSASTHTLLLKMLGVRICLNQYPWLFLARDYGRRGRVVPRTIQRWIKKMTKEAKLNAKISCHSFRHSKAHEILRKGGGAIEIQKVLGHSENNPMSAFSYLRLNDAEFEKIADRFL